jgi:hypothetical protein
MATMERSEGLRETVAEAIYDCDSLRASDPGLFQMIKGAAYYSGSVAHGISLEDADAALNAITEAGFVIVHRDDLELAVSAIDENLEWDCLADESYAVNRLRAAMAATDIGPRKDGL